MQRKLVFIWNLSAIGLFPSTNWWFITYFYFIKKHFFLPQGVTRSFSKMIDEIQCFLAYCLHASQMKMRALKILYDEFFEIWKRSDCYLSSHSAQTKKLSHKKFVNGIGLGNKTFARINSGQKYYTTSNSLTPIAKMILEDVSTKDGMCDSVGKWKSKHKPKTKSWHTVL